jgi:UDP-N-acetylmuramate--alanine ligase
VARELDIDVETIRKALQEFSGVQRRFQVKGEAKEVLVVDDYGHHPTEVRATLAAAKAGGGRRVVCLFQPHRYSRTKHLLDEFFTAFNQADVVVIMDIYAAGEQPIEGITGQVVCDGIRKHGHKDAVHIAGRDAVVEHLLEALQPGDLLLTLGAGDVWKLGETVLERLRS